MTDNQPTLFIVCEELGKPKRKRSAWYTNHVCSECVSWNPEDGRCSRTKEQLHGWEEACYRLKLWRDE